MQRWAITPASAGGRPEHEDDDGAPCSSSLPAAGRYLRATARTAAAWGVASRLATTSRSARNAASAPARLEDQAETAEGGSEYREAAVMTCCCLLLLLLPLPLLLPDAFIASSIARVVPPPAPSKGVVRV